MLLIRTHPHPLCMDALVIARAAQGLYYESFDIAENQIAMMPKKDKSNAGVGQKETTSSYGAAYGSTYGGEEKETGSSSLKMFDYQGLRALSKTLRDMSGLRMIDMSFNILGGVGGEILCENLPIKLQELKLGFCNIGPRGAHALAETIPHRHKTLVRVELPRNNIGDSGCCAILGSLSVTAAKSGGGSGGGGGAIQGNSLASSGAPSRRSSGGVASRADSKTTAEGGAPGAGATGANAVDSSSTPWQRREKQQHDQDDEEEMRNDHLIPKLRKKLTGALMNAGAHAGGVGPAKTANIARDPVLEYLDLHGNNIGNQGGTSLMATLETNLSLLNLVLSDNMIPPLHERVIKRALGFNNQYKNLKLRNAAFDKDVEKFTSGDANTTGMGNQQPGAKIGAKLMAENLRTWASGDMFISQRLISRLTFPRDELEAEVAK